MSNLACRLLGDATAVATRMARLRSAAPSIDLLDAAGARSLSAQAAATRARASYIAGATATTSLSGHRAYHVPLRARQTDLARSWSSSGRDSRFHWVQHAPNESIVRFEGSVAEAKELAAAYAAGPSSREPASIEVAFDQFVEVEALLVAEFSRAGLLAPLLYVSDSVSELLVRELSAESEHFAGVCVEPARGDELLSLSAELVAIEENGRWAPRMSALGSVAASSDPGRKLLVRYVDAHGVPVADVAHATRERMQPPNRFELVLRDTGRRIMLSATKGDPLLAFVMRSGRRTEPSKPLHEVLTRAEAEMSHVAPAHRRLRQPSPYPVGLSVTLYDEKTKLFAQH